LQLEELKGESFSRLAADPSLADLDDVGCHLPVRSGVALEYVVFRIEAFGRSADEE
jgi:hypothetical protein